MRKLIYLLFLLPLIFTSCKSKKNLVKSNAFPALIVDSIQPDSSDLVAMLFAPDHSQLKDLQRRKPKKRARSTATRSTAELVPGGVAPGTVITSSKVPLSTHKQGVDRVMNYDFTHRDVPEAFDGFRIAFISDLHYKSLFTGKRLQRLVSFLKSQNADVLLMGGDYQEGCEYVPELFEALSQVKTPLGTMNRIS